MIQLPVQTSPRGDPLAVAGGRKAGSAPAPHGKEPPGSPPGTPFSTVLDDQARTAVAEGQQRSDRLRTPVGEREPRDSTDDSAASGDGSTPTPQAAAAALAALLGGVPLPAEVATAVVARLPGEVVPAPAANGAAGQPLPLGAATTGDPTAMPTGPAVPAAASALPLRPVASAPRALDASASQTLAEQPVLPAAEGSSDAADARATRLADVLQSAAARPAVSASAPAASPTAAAIPSPATVAGSAAGGASGNAADGSGQAPAQSAPPAAAPVAAAPAPSASAFAPSTPAAATAARGVGLEQAVETVRLTLRASADRGVSHARISLTPRELGGIEVHLRQTADGLVARVVAEHATAAQLLQHAGGELRRSLESQGLNLLRLDIGASGEQAARNGDRRALADGFADGDGRGSRGDASDPLAPLDGATDADLTSTTTTLALPNGALVDVLA